CPIVVRDTLVYIIVPTTIEDVNVPDSACAGSTVPLTFVTTGGAFDTGNQFRAEFSTDGETWTNTYHGTINLTGSNLTPPAATIQVDIPDALATGRYYYRVR